MTTLKSSRRKNMRFRIKKQLAFLFTVIIIAVQFPYAALAETDVRDIQTVAPPVSNR